MARNQQMTRLFQIERKMLQNQPLFDYIDPLNLTYLTTRFSGII